MTDRGAQSDMKYIVEPFVNVTHVTYIILFSLNFLIWISMQILLHRWIYKTLFAKEVSASVQ